MKIVNRSILVLLFVAVPLVIQFISCAHSTPKGKTPAEKTTEQDRSPLDQKAPLEFAIAGEAASRDDFRRPSAPPSDPDGPAISDYQEILDSLLYGEEPIKVVIGSGRKYWLEVLISRIFDIHSPEYQAVLDWIVNLNRQFQDRADLNRILAGQEMLLPTKKFVQRQMTTNL